MNINPKYTAQIAAILERAKSFVYYSQEGNLGDLLIAEATRQLFGDLNILYTEYKEEELPEHYTLVHSGGGRFIPYWCNIDKAIKQLCNDNVTQCIILPSSFSNVDDLLKNFDERHTIFCRDPYSYEYCKSMCPKSTVFIANDMGFYLRLIDLRPVPTTNAEAYCISEDEISTLNSIRNGLFEHLHEGIKRAIVKAPLGGREKAIAFILRSDKEKGTKYKSEAAFDASIIWNTTGSHMMFNGNVLRQFSHALKQADVIVSDRLHVCIMAYLSGREVYMIDNNYRKLSGVYEQTLKDDPRAHLLSDGILTPELEAAWEQLQKEWEPYARRQKWKKALKSLKVISIIIKIRRKIMAGLRKLCLFI